MSENRFAINLEDECIDDAEERIFISFLDKIDFYELCVFLNEQQATIDEQKIIIEERDVANERLNRFLIEIGLEKEYIKWEFKKGVLNE